MVASAFGVTSTFSQEAPDLERGAAVYAQNCAFCHGAEGEGNLGIPALAGAAGHVAQLGIPPEQAGPGVVQMLREGIPGNMPAFPPELLSDEDIGHLGAYLFTLPPTTGANIYTATCAVCHGALGEGGVGPKLAGAAEKFAALGVSKEQLAAGFPDLARDGIPARMPGAPWLADVEVERLFEYLWTLDSWEAEFQAKHGRAPTEDDRAAREWSLIFTQETGREPTDADWITHYFDTQR